MSVGLAGQLVDDEELWQTWRHTTVVWVMDRLSVSVCAHLVVTVCICAEL